MTSKGELIAGRYRLVAPVGTGAMGVVWEANDERLQRVVAVKQLLLHSGMSASEAEEANRRAMREGRIAARLHHQHAISVYDVAEHDGQPFLIMEYLSSESLSTVLATRGVLAPKEAARIGGQIAAALAAAHDAGIVHRDVKPGNVLLAEDGTAKITDFGISRAAGDSTVTATGVLPGTPAYFAPEVAKGQSADFSADVFSLGATLYAAVEGVPPFGLDDNALALLYRVATSEIVPPEQAGPLTPVLERLLQRNPSQRPTMQQAHEALRAIAAPPSSRSHRPATIAVPPPTAVSGPASAPSPAGPAGITAPYTDPSSLSTEPSSTHPSSTEPSSTEPSFTEPSSSSPAPLSPAPSSTEPAAPPPGPPRGHRDQPPERRDRLARRAALVVTALVASLIVASIILVTTLVNGEEESTAGQAPITPSPTQDTPQNEPPPPPPPTVEATTQPAPTPAPAPPAPAPQSTPEQLQAAISDYYALMPTNLQAGWPRLTADYQRNHAGGFSGYQAFWRQIERVEVSNVTATSPDSVTANIRYFYPDGRVIEEQTNFGMVSEGGQWKIASSSVNSSRTVQE